MEAVVDMVVENLETGVLKAFRQRHVVAAAGK